MKHTYLVEVGQWNSTGMLFDTEGRSIPVEGVTQIVHQEKVWVLDNKIRLRGQDKVATHHRYAVSPWTFGQASVAWLSNNEALGRLTGRFTFVEDAILSFYHSDTGGHFGSESFIEENESTYTNRGALYRADQLISSWALKLTRRA